MKHKLSNRRRRAGILTLILAVAILVTGTLAWQAISQRAVNNVAGKILPAGARLHDDFGLADEPDFKKPLNKDVYVENYSGQNPLNTNDQGEPMFVRVKLMEYMEMGVGAGLFELTGDDPSDYQTLDQVDANGTRAEDTANDATSLVAGASILELSTWRTHIQGDTANPFASYWNWTMGGTKAFMPTFNKDNTSLLADRTDYAHDKFTVGDKEDGTALYSNPTYDNNPEEHTAKDTLTTAGIVSMDEWMNDLNHPMEDSSGNGYWVGDSDGWYYWSKGLEPGEATALLLDQITLTGTIEGEFYYGIHVISEMATAGDWGDATDETGFYEDGLTANGKYLLDQAAASFAKGKKILYAPMDDIGTTHLNTMLLYAPMDGIGYSNENAQPTAPFTDRVNNKDFSILGGSVTHNTSHYKVGSQSAYFSGEPAQRLNASIPDLNFGTKDFTVSFWANPDVQTSAVPLFFANEVNTTNLAFAAIAGSGQPIKLYSWNSVIIDTGKYLPVNSWTHYAIVRKNGTFTVYQNGINIGSTSSYPTATIDLSNLSIGGNNDPLNAYKGYLDDFAIYDYAVWDSDFTPSTDAQTDADLVYLDFEEAVPPVPDGPIKEVISNTNFSILGNAIIEGKDDQYKFGGSSLYFPGTAGQRMNIHDQDLNFGTKDFTVSFWANPDVQTMSVPLFFANEVNTTNLAFAGMAGTGQPIKLYSWNSVIIDTGKYLPVGNWTHYAIVRKNGTFTVYQNGINIGSTSGYPTATVDLSNLSVGGNSDPVNAYKGYMDDFTIYDYAKYDGDFTPPTVPANVDPANSEPDELEIKDKVSGNDFTVFGSASVIGTDAQKKFGNASLYFPGTPGQRINIQEQELNFGTKDFTVSFWTNPDVQTMQVPLFFANEVNTTNLAFAGMAGSGQPIKLYSWNNVIIDTGQYLLVNSWTHYAIVRKNGTFTVYQNGINIGSTSSYPTATIDLSNLSIGGNSDPINAYKGYMQDFSVYNYAVWDSDFTPPDNAGTP